MSSKTKAAFIDRDGVINEERNYVHRIEDFILLPGAVEGLTLLHKAGYRLIVVTNQAGIAHGYYDKEDVDRLHDHLRAQLIEHGVNLDAIYYCPHHPLGIVSSLTFECDCRKPSPGMLLQAAKDLELDIAASVLIGDKVSDIQAGKRAGVRCAIIVESGHKIESSVRLEADMVAKDLLSAARVLTASCFF